MDGRTPPTTRSGEHPNLGHRNNLPRLLPIPSGKIQNTASIILGILASLSRHFGNELKKINSMRTEARLSRS
jgi:hypothetical protein